MDPDLVSRRADEEEEDAVGVVSRRPEQSPVGEKSDGERKGRNLAVELIDGEESSKSLGT